MRTITLLVFALGCKKQQATVATAETGTAPDTDTEVTDTDTDTDTTASPCWVPFDSSRCWDTTLEGCALPTTPGADNAPFLNQCTDSDYIVVDNAARIPASTWIPGTPLPPVP